MKIILPVIGFLAIACLVVNLVIYLMMGNNSDSNVVNESLITLRNNINNIALGSIVVAAVVGVLSGLKK
jgi:heme/copper-type cytochrome/quinol oxidase subunit 4